MKNIYIHSDSSNGQRKQIIASATLGRNKMPIGSQIPAFAEYPLVFCSYYCPGYENAYGETGIVFESSEQPIYACPADSFELIREGNYLSGHEQFVFGSIEEMLKKYPRSVDFRRDFQTFFNTLNPKLIYPRFQELAEAKTRQTLDYSQGSLWITEEGNNEIAFNKPLPIKVLYEFNTKEDLKRFFLLNPL